jgi:hypothetical protein
MPIVKEIKGNLVELFKEGKYPLIAHPVLCTETLTTEFAKDLTNSFEDVAKVQKEFPLPAIYRLGDYSVVPTEAGTVLNFYTQLSINTSYEYCALKNCLKKLSMEAMNAGTYIELAVVVNEVGNLDVIKKILNVQESLLITIVHHDKGQVSVGEGQAE